MNPGTLQSKMIDDGGMENTNITNAIKKKLQISAPHSRISGGCSIHRVPQKFHKMRDPSAYMPQVVSIGPYHRAHESLKSREDLKLLYAHKLLAKKAEEGDSEYARIVQEEEDTRAIKMDLSGMLVATTEAWLEECVSSIKKKETEIRQCYSEPVNLTSAEFVEMMIIDGLFLIGMLMRSDLRRSYAAVADDPFDGNDWLLFMVEQDMLLLENQIPLSVLRCLFSIIFSVEDESRINSLNKDILDFITKMWQRMLPTHEMIPFEAHPDQCEHAEHLLDCLVILIKPPAHTDSAGCESSSSWKIVQILTKLRDNMVVKFTITQYSSLKLFIQTQIMKQPKRIRLLDEERVNHSDEYCDYFLPSATELRRAGVKFSKGSTTKGRSILDIRFSSTC